MSTASNVESFAAYAAAAPAARFSDWLRHASEPLWTDMIGHRFTQDMAMDKLAPEVFKRYLVYEHAFVDTAVTIFGYALVRAPSILEQKRLVEVLRGLTDDQNDFFDRAFDALGVPDNLRRRPPLPASVQAFRDGMLVVAAHRSYEDILAAILGAEWMYLTWCEAAHARRPQAALAAEWIALHVAEPFADQVRWLRGQLDSCGPALPPWRQDGAAAAFRRTLELEIAFHDAPYGANVAP
jgi:thiaminase/transcriptional activator TenA